MPCLFQLYYKSYIHFQIFKLIGVIKMKKNLLFPILFFALIFAGCTKEIIVSPNNSNDPYSVLTSGTEYHSHFRMTQLSDGGETLIFDTCYNFAKWDFTHGKTSPKVFFNLNPNNGEELRLEYLIVWNVSTPIRNLMARYELHHDTTSGYINRYDILLPFNSQPGSRGYLSRSQIIPTTYLLSPYSPFATLNLVDDGTTGDTGYFAGVTIKLSDEFGSAPMTLLDEEIHSKQDYISPLYVIHSKKADRTLYVDISGVFKHRFLDYVGDNDRIIYRVYDEVGALLVSKEYFYSTCVFVNDGYHFYKNSINPNDFSNYLLPDNVYKLQMEIKR